MEYSRWRHSGWNDGTYYKLEKQLKNGPRKFYQLEWMRNNDGYVTTEIQMPESVALITPVENATIESRDGFNNSIGQQFSVSEQVHPVKCWPIEL